MAPTLSCVSTTIGFSTTHADISLYTKRSKESLTIIELYVNDLLQTGSKKDSIAEVLRKTSAKYKVRLESGKSKFLGMVIEDTKDGIFTHNKCSIQNLRQHFGMYKSNLSATPFLGGFGSMIHDSVKISDQ